MFAKTTSQLKAQQEEVLQWPESLSRDDAVLACMLADSVKLAPVCCFVF